jgi:hypothetical protein
MFGLLNKYNSFELYGDDIAPDGKKRLTDMLDYSGIIALGQEHFREKMDFG